MNASETVPILVIAGVSSGVGKTTVTLGLLEALRGRGLAVQAFKVGPDFIDAAYHALATGQPSYNLDGWMCGPEQVVATVGERAAHDALALVEGVMGCFDGTDGLSEDGSTAQIAKWLGAPVILVLDAGALVRSAAAVVLGFEHFDPELALAGVVFNRTGGSAHRQWLSQAVARVCKARPLGALPHDPDVRLPERHLGLVTAVEGGYSPELRQRLAGLIEAHVDLNALVGLARSQVARRAAPRARSTAASATIAVARDPAFQFYYPDNLEALERAGHASPFGARSRTRRSQRRTGCTSAADTRSSMGAHWPPMWRCGRPCGRSRARAGRCTPSAAGSCTWPSRSPTWTATSGRWRGCSPRQS